MSLVAEPEAGCVVFSCYIAGSIGSQNPGSQGSTAGSLPGGTEAKFGDGDFAVCSVTVVW